MYVWSKRLVIGLLAAFVLALVVFLTQGQQGEASALKIHATSWIILNYVGLVLWVFVRMIDQTRMRGEERMGVALTLNSCPLAYADGTHPVSSAPDESLIGPVQPSLNLG